MFRHRVRVSSVVAAVLGAAVLVSACGSDEENNADICKTEVTAASSPVTGALTLSGMFYSDETVILSYLDGGITKQVSGTPATDRTSFTLTGLPSGDKSFTVIVSCDAGRENNGSRTYTVK